MLVLLLGLARLGQTYKRTFILGIMNLYKNLYFVSTGDASTVAGAC